ncbi:MAG: hypothetical protein HRT47_12440 [Candidatus Caenarcaniphilales bacterium]|nr:hypothetical protein [Candidatus Caenarcaniphilales bacterium]
MLEKIAQRALKKINEIPYKALNKVNQIRNKQTHKQYIQSRRDSQVHVENYKNGNALSNYQNNIYNAQKLIASTNSETQNHTEQSLSQEDLKELQEMNDFVEEFTNNLREFRDSSNSNNNTENVSRGYISVDDFYKLFEDSIQQNNNEQQNITEKPKPIHKQVEINAQKMQIAYELRNISNLEALFLDIDEQIGDNLSDPKNKEKMEELSEKYELSKDHTEQFIRTVKKKPSFIDNYLKLGSVIQKFYSKDGELYDESRLDKSTRAILAYIGVNLIPKIRPATLQILGINDLTSELPPNLDKYANKLGLGNLLALTGFSAVAERSNLALKASLGNRLKNPLIREMRDQFTDYSYRRINDASKEHKLSKDLLSKILQHHSLARKKIGPLVSSTFTEALPSLVGAGLPLAVQWSTGNKLLAGINLWNGVLAAKTSWDESTKNNHKDIEINELSQTISKLTAILTGNGEEQKLKEEKIKELETELAESTDHFINEQEQFNIEELIDSEKGVNALTEEQNVFNNVAKVVSYRNNIILGAFTSMFSTSLLNFDLETLWARYFTEGSTTVDSVMDFQNLIKEVIGDIPNATEPVASMFETLELLEEGNIQALEQKYNISPYKDKIESNKKDFETKKLPPKAK